MSFRSAVLAFECGTAMFFGGAAQSNFSVDRAVFCELVGEPIEQRNRYLLVRSLELDMTAMNLP
ncbi:hypothetical protein WN73_15450 [Bradyrhizobium sp. CCBAU 45394]|nr:hypothetical protein [Bradyrhizobium sp. CCBAU 45394]